jgi:LmbE family N-acetylglucosaminyl deacetylase
VVGRVSGLIERNWPQVVVSYDAEGMYQHLDHVQAARAAEGAVAATGIPARFCLTAMRPSSWRKIWGALREAGEDVPGPREVTDEMRAQMEVAERRITTTVDIRRVLERKREALFARSSQIAESWVSKIPAEIAREASGVENFIKAKDCTGALVPKDDLFAGLGRPRVFRTAELVLFMLRAAGSGTR